VITFIIFVESFMGKLFVTLLLGSAFLFPAASFAEGSYLKLGVGETTYAGVPITTGLPIDSNRTTTAGFIAYGRSIAPNFAAEIGYVDFGTSGMKSNLFGGDLVVVDRLKTRSIYVAGVDDVPLSSAVSFQGKLGIVMHHTNTHFSLPAFGLNFTDNSTFNKTRALVGAGFKFRFSKEISGVAEYTYFGTAVDGSELSLLSAGLLYHF
jgi:hypothetical protein